MEESTNSKIAKVQAASFAKAEQIYSDANTRSDGIEKALREHVQKSEASQQSLRNELQKQAGTIGSLQTKVVNLEDTQEQLRAELAQERAARIAAEEANAVNQAQSDRRLDELAEANKKVSLSVTVLQNGN